MLAMPNIDRETIQEKRRLIEDKLEGYDDAIYSIRDNEFDGLEKREHIILLE